MGQDLSRRLRDAEGEEVTPALESTLEDEQRKNKSPLIWYRHSGQPEIDRIPYEPPYKAFQGEREIITDVGEHDITHMAVANAMIPHIDVVAPNLTDLRIEGVNELPQLQCLNLSHLTRLKTLDLSHNDFPSGIPAFIGEMSSLCELYLTSCQLTSLPESLSQLTQLELLDLSYNNLSAGLPAVIGEMSSLHTLNLMRCRLTTLPECLSQLTQLSRLGLHGNNFSADLPAVIGKMINLKEIILNGCELTSLPQSLSQLIQLKRLDLYGNDFYCGLPAVIGEINSLEELNLWNCQLTTLPESLSRLTQLKTLVLRGNDFSAGVPAVVGEMNSLKGLYLSECKLTDLPVELQKLKELKVLNLPGNQFEQLPAVIFKLTELQTLELEDNKKLVRIDDDIRHLKKLTELECSGCESLVTPPYNVCNQGLGAVKKYFSDLRISKGIEQTVVPVAIIGTSMSGKTSLVRSLKTERRCPTYRTTNTPLDEATKGFQVEYLQLASSQLKFLEYGDNKVYRAAYRMMIKERYLPLIVVNLEEFFTLSSTIGSKEATRKVCLDWLEDLYQICPGLGRPILAITHVHKMSKRDVKSCIKEFLKQAEVIRQDVIREESESQSEHTGGGQKTVYFSNTQIPLFAPEDTFQFGYDPATTSNIQSLKANLEERSKEFTFAIPHLWEEFASFIHGHLDTPYVSISDITSKYEEVQAHTILRFMHNIGDILWFENVDGLQGHVFHQLPAITEMITVLLHHCSAHQWKAHLANFTTFHHDHRLISKAKYEKLIDEFITSGVIEKVLLLNLLERKSKFPPEVALRLLKHIHIANGPIEIKGGDSYVIPFCARLPKDDLWKTNGTLQLRVEIILDGLSLPKYVHQLITVTVLNETLGSTNTIEVANNGATIYHGENTTHLVHDFVGQMVTIQISTPVELLGDSWKLLIDTAKSVFSLLSQEWTACHALFKFYCSHCLFLDDPNPDFDVDPCWFRPMYDCSRSDTVGTSVHTESFQGIQPVTCNRDASRSNSKSPTVCKPLKFPCYELSADETEELNEYLSDIESGRYQDTAEVDAADGVTDSGRFTLEHRREEEEEEDSELSDVESEGYCDPSADPKIQMRLRIVKNKSMKELYRDHEKAYKMNDKVRGRVLIINMSTRQSKQQYSRRDGLDIDYYSISTLFKKLRFDIAKDKPKLMDLTAEEIYGEIREETSNPEHAEKDLGMFVLVLLSLGKTGDILLDVDGQPVELVKVCDLLSPLNFPAMKRKPKLIILQAFSGDRYDFGLGDTPADPPSTATGTAADPPSTATEAAADPPSTATEAASNPPSTTTKAAADPPSTTTEAAADPPSTATAAAANPPSTATDTAADSPSTATEAAADPSSTATATGAGRPNATSAEPTDCPTPPTTSAAAASRVAPTTLNVDDFFIMNLSNESYIPLRSHVHGSWVIRILVATFYRHAHSRDIETLFKIVQHRVRKVSLTHKGNTMRGNVPISTCTFSDLKKLYLFPGYPPLKG